MNKAAQEIGSRVRAARKAKGLTLRQLGDMVGVSFPFVHDVEHGRRSIAKERRAPFAKALDVHPIYLTEFNADVVHAVADLLEREDADPVIVRRLRLLAKKGTT